VLHEQRTAQQDKLDVSKADSKRSQESDAAVIAKYQDQLSRQESDSKRMIQILEQRADAADHNLADANRSAQALRAELSKKSLEMEVPPAAHKEQTDALQARLREQEALVDSLSQRANAISTRYKEGNLVSNISEAYWFRHSLDMPERR